MLLDCYYSRNYCFRSNFVFYLFNLIRKIVLLFHISIYLYNICIIST